MFYENETSALQEARKGESTHLVTERQNRNHQYPSRQDLLTETFCRRSDIRSGSGDEQGCAGVCLRGRVDEFVRVVHVDGVAVAAGESIRRRLYAKEGDELRTFRRS